MAESREYLLVLDVGTGSGRAILFNLSGELIGFKGREWQHSADPNYQGALDFNVEANWLSLEHSIREVMAKAAVAATEVKAISITSMRHGMVCYDDKGSAIAAFPNADARAEAEVKWLISTGLAKRIYKIGGDWPSVHDVARLLWLKKNKPDLFGKIDRFTMLEGWPIVKLCGTYVTDPSSASSSGLFDVVRRSWSDEIIKACHLPIGIFPEVMDAGNKVGVLRREIAQELGLSAGTPVIMAGGDTQCGLLGSGVVEDGQAGVVAGTFWLDCVVLSEAIIDDRFELRTSCHIVPGKWIFEGVSFVGMFTRWFRDALCSEEKQRAIREGKDAYKILDEEAAEVPPGAYGIQVCMSNIFNASNWVHTAPMFLNWDVWDTTKSAKEVFYRALLENVAYQTRGEFKNILRLAETSLSEVVFCGGAAKSKLWSQVLADVLGAVIRVPRVNEATALGAAICAAAGIDQYANISAAAKAMVKVEEAFAPNLENASVYGRMYDQWRKIYEHMLVLSKDGILKPLWKVAGT
ncbi:MAG: autoinducer-2 kinase [Desulfobacterales bacterium]|nr:MAG: autoinducer-2 kinase [Desulfobacterales bacterium]